MTATLPSWNDTAARRAVIDFVGRVTDESGPDYVPQIERIVVFDNDGTLWCEQPIPVQLASDSDVAMMEVASASSKPYLNLLVRHDDAEREYTYDKSAEKAQAAAGERGWTVVSMKNDWQTIFG